MENGWKSPILLPLEPVGTRPSSHLEDFDSHKVGARWEEVVGSASCIPCPGKVRIIPNRKVLRWEGRRFQPLVCLCRSWRGWGWLGQGWIGQLVWLTHLLWRFFIFISSVLGLRCSQDEQVSYSNKEMGPTAFISTRIFIVQTSCWQLLASLITVLFGKRVVPFSLALQTFLSSPVFCSLLALGAPL